jgi:hypothetical protein
MPFGRVTRVLIGTIVMAIVVRSLALALNLPDKDALAVLLPCGVGSYLAMGWFLDIAKCRHRVSHGLMVMRNALARG